MNLLNNNFVSVATRTLITLASISCFAVAAQTTAPKTAISAQAAQPKGAATSANVEPLEIKLERAKIVSADNKETRQSAAIAKPGEILEETATYTNKSAAALKGLEATLPVPINTELVMGSVSPANAKASTDGKNFSTIPLTRKIKQANGVEVEQAVPLSEYRYLRWYPGELAAQKSLAFSARFKVASDASQAVSAVKR